jgi:hypothetical protein
MRRTKIKIMTDAFDNLNIVNAAYDFVLQG